MGDLLFESQRQWGEGQSDSALFITYAQKLGLDMAQFEKDRKDPATKTRVERNKNEGQYIGIK